MKQAIKRIRPASGYSHVIHLMLMIVLPLIAYVLVRINLSQLAIGIVLLSKWRVLAVRPRHWLAYIRANAVDIVVGVSIVLFMTQTNSQIWQIIWTVVYMTWLLLIKPSSTLLGISAQALIAQIFGLMALYLVGGGPDTYVLVIGTGAVTYVSARHFFSAFDEPYTRFLSDIWAYFGAALAWILSHWLLYYGLVSQVTLLLSVFGFGLGTMYYLQKNNRLSRLIQRQLVFIMIAITIVVLVFSSWGDKTV